MKLDRLFRRGRKIVDSRGGVDALKDDAKELRDIAKGEGTLKDKAKAAATALKEPGAQEAAPADPAPGATAGAEKDAPATEG